MISAECDLIVNHNNYQNLKNVIALLIKQILKSHHIQNVFQSAVYIIQT